MTDIDELERLAEAATPGPWCDRGFGGIQPESGGSLVAVTVTKGGCLPDYVENSAYIAAANPTAILELVAEVRRLQTALNTPQLTAAYAPYLAGIVGVEGVSQEVAADFFMNSAQLVTVYYGEKRVFTNLAEFCAAHLREKA